MKRDRDNVKFEKLAAGLLLATRVSDGDIESALSHPDLFESILARVEAASPRRSTLSWLNVRSLSAAAAMAVVLIVAISAVLISRGPSLRRVAVVPVVKIPELTDPETARSPSPVEGNEVGKLSQNRAENPNFERTVVRETTREIKPRAKPTRARNETEFYSLSTSESSEPTSGGRVVRVDMPRSALFAMGVNIPLENDSPTVKAELIVGPDGVTRAIRLVD